MHISRLLAQQPPPHAHSSRGTDPFQPAYAPNHHTAGTSRAFIPLLGAPLGTRRASPLQPRRWARAHPSTPLQPMGARTACCTRWGYPRRRGGHRWRPRAAVRHWRGCCLRVRMGAPASAVCSVRVSCPPTHTPPFGRPAAASPRCALQARSPPPPPPPPPPLPPPPLATAALPPLRRHERRLTGRTAPFAQHHRGGPGLPATYYLLICRSYGRGVQ